MEKWKHKRKIYWKLRTQLLVLFLVLTIVPLIIFSILIYRNSVKSITEQAQGYFMQSVEKSSVIVDKEFDYIDEFAQKLNIDSRLYEIFKNLDKTDEVSLMNANSRITAILNHISRGAAIFIPFIWLHPISGLGRRTKTSIPKALL